MTDSQEPDDSMAADISSPFSTVPVEITVSVGKARPTVQELLQMGENTVLALDRKVEDPVELYVGDQLIARGELEEREGEFAGQIAVRLTAINDLKDSLG